MLEDNNEDRPPPCSSGLKAMLTAQSSSMCSMCLMLPCICSLAEDDDAINETDGDASIEKEIIDLSEPELELDIEQPIAQHQPGTTSTRLPPLVLTDSQKILFQSLAPEITPILKQHQVEGIEFLSTAIEENNGVLLADFMGLGKTLQVLTTLQRYISNSSETLPTALVLCPTICIQNWQQEYTKWFSEASRRDAPLSVFSSVTSNINDRLEVLEAWKKSGGILLMGYEMYRLLLSAAASSSSASSTHSSSSGMVSRVSSDTVTMDFETSIAIGAAKRERVAATLVNPGPDLIVLDEGHRIKDPTSRLCQHLSAVATKKRIVLTGYPMQNRLAEYWCMIQFARPGFLGKSYEHFRDSTEAPILNAPSDDIARRLTTALNTRLKPMVLRRSQDILKNQLPPKYEWLIECTLSDIQRKLYTNFLSNRVNVDFLSAYAALLQIVNHPDLANKNNKDVTTTNLWESSGKLLVLQALLESSASVGDKVLIFSQSVGTLECISKMITECYSSSSSSKKESKEDSNNNKNCKKKNRRDPAFLQRSRKRRRVGVVKKSSAESSAVGRYFFQIDGSTPTAKRVEYIREFNDPDSAAKVMLVSTRAGAEGINLHAANRVVLFDVSWNPSHDQQSMCRSHRFGQKKPVHVYRLMAADSIEKHIYNLQVRKIGLANSVVDERESFAVGKNAAKFFTELPVDPSPACPLELAKAVKKGGSEDLDPCLMHLVDNIPGWISSIQSV